MPGLDAERFANFLRSEQGMAHAQADTEVVVCPQREFVDMAHQWTALSSMILARRPYSHSIVPGGLLVTSYTTRFTPFTSLMMRVATRPMKSISKEWKSAVMPSLE